jgi:hypothetical protein
MKFVAISLLAIVFLASPPAAPAADSAIALCGPNDGYVTLYMSIDTFEMAARLPCGAPLELLESQKTYAAQHTFYVRVATEDGKQGYVARTAITVVYNPPQPDRAAAKSALQPASAGAPFAVPSEMRVLDGAELEVKLSADLSSDRTAEGAIVSLEVSEPLVIDGVTVFERGAPARARITEVRKAARLGRDGEISWAMLDVTAVDRTRIPARFPAESQSSSGAAGIVAATGNSMLGAQTSFSLRKGDAAFIPAGQIFRVFLHGDTMVHLAQPMHIAQQ